MSSIKETDLKKKNLANKIIIKKRGDLQIQMIKANYQRQENKLI